MAVTSKPSASSGRLAIIEEENYGVTPAGNLKEISFLSETLQKTANNIESESIDNGEMVTQAKQVGVGASGEVNMEMVLDNDDLLLQGAMKNEYDSYSIVATDIAAVASGNKLTSTGTDFTTKFLSGMFVKITGFETNEINRPVKILTVAANEMTIAGFTLVDEASGGKSITINGKRIINGTMLRSFSLEKSFKDKNGDDVFFTYPGACVGSVAFSMPQEDKITIAYNLMAKTENSPEASIGSGYDDAEIGNFMDTSKNMIYTLLGNSEIVPSSISNIEINNNLRMQKGVSSEFLQGIGKGKQRVSGTLEMYFEGKEIYNKFNANTEDSLDIVIQDESGEKWMVISIPKVKYTSHPVPLAGTESDILSNVEFTGIKDNDKAYQVAIFKQSDFVEPAE